VKATLKLLIHLLLYKLVSALVFPTKKIQRKHLAIVRIDGIGDYVLFRNFIKTIHESEQYKNYKITLIGNSLWKDLAIELDDEFVDKFIWIDRSKFHKNLFYRYKKLKEITLQAYEAVINPVYSRGFFSEDAIIKAIHANEKIGSNGDLSNIKKWQKKNKR
jgi:ADP-heptose:LPS heptosyltransferase